MKNEDKWFYTFLFISTLCVITVAVTVVIGINKQEKINRYDVNEDGTVNAKDYIEIKKYIMNKEK